MLAAVHHPHFFCHCHCCCCCHCHCCSDCGYISSSLSPDFSPSCCAATCCPTPYSVRCHLRLLLHHSCLLPYPICSLIGCCLLTALIVLLCLAVPLLSSSWLSRFCLCCLLSHCCLSLCCTLCCATAFVALPPHAMPLLSSNWLLCLVAARCCQPPLPTTAITAATATCHHHHCRLPPSIILQIINRIHHCCPSVISIITDAAIVCCSSPPLALPPSMVQPAAVNLCHLLLPPTLAPLLTTVRLCLCQPLIIVGFCCRLPTTLATSLCCCH